jgi:hypothetical protein
VDSYGILYLHTFLKPDCIHGILKELIVPNQIRSYYRSVEERMQVVYSIFFLGKNTYPIYVVPLSLCSSPFIFYKYHVSAQGVDIVHVFGTLFLRFWDTYLYHPRM